MTDSNLLALLFYGAALSWGIGVILRARRFDFSAAIAMLMATIICLQGGYSRWNKEPQVMVIDRSVSVPQSQ